MASQILIFNNEPWPLIGCYRGLEFLLIFQFIDLLRLPVVAERCIAWTKQDFLLINQTLALSSICVYPRLRLNLVVEIYRK